VTACAARSSPVLDRSSSNGASCGAISRWDSQTSCAAISATTASLGPGKDEASGGGLNRDNPSGNDIIRGGGGDDELNGHDGADVLIGGPGTDICRGGPGADDIINCEN
jgi:Ca2+-binding RTX toxin-like protein